MTDDKAAADTDTAQEAVPWVKPDYSTIAAEADLAGSSPFRDWPGPPLVMPAGLLPDGKPPGSNEMDNSLRIEGVRPRSEAEANACVWAYWGQQNLLRDELGLPHPTRRAPSYKQQDTPETLAAIAELHQQERERRRRAE
ncbi:MAG TPA: hypothetical protein VGD71_10240 [Kribbella sp.]|jgi:hypothetical protein